MVSHDGRARRVRQGRRRPRGHDPRRRGAGQTDTATSIRDGVVTDGPFVETKEAFGGYYLVEAARPGPGARDRQALPGPGRRRRGPAGHGLRLARDAAPPRRPDAVADAHRREWAFVLAATVRVAGDLDLAEECVAGGLRRRPGRPGPRDGVPARPGAWLTTAARRRALDLLRRDATLRGSCPCSSSPTTLGAPLDGAELGRRGRRPRRPAAPGLHLLPPRARSRGPGRADAAPRVRAAHRRRRARVPRPEPTMAARITRAKKKIAQARIPYRVPAARGTARTARQRRSPPSTCSSPPGTPPRPASSSSARRLVERAVDLARMLRAADARRAEVAGLLGLLAAHRRTPCHPGGRRRPVAAARGAGPPAWDAPQIAEGLAWSRRRCARPTGPVHAAGRDRRRARRSAVLRRNRLGAGRRTSTTCC